MKQYRTALLAKQFPFLLDISKKLNLKLTSLDDIQVEKGDRELLRKKGIKDYKLDRRSHGHRDYVWHFAVIAKGKNDYDILQLDYEEDVDTTEDTYQSNADSIGEQLFTGKLDPLYIVECKCEDQCEYGTKEALNIWTIFKMKDFNQVSFHKLQIEKAAEQLKREIVAVWGAEK